MNIGQLFAGAGIIVLIFIIILAIGWMRIFKKSGRPQLMAVFPVLNIIEYSKIAGKPGWWGLLWSGLIILSFVFSHPIVQIVVGIGDLFLWVIITLGLAKNFGKGGGFTVGLLLLPGIFHCILGFGSAQYLEPEEQQHVV